MQNQTIFFYSCNSSNQYFWILWLHSSNKPCFSTNKRQYSKSWHNFEQSNLCCNINDDQSLNIKLNPYAIEKHQPNEDKLIHYKFEEYYQSRSCGKNKNAQKRNQTQQISRKPNINNIDTLSS
jgi:hypothetical protein